MRSKKKLACFGGEKTIKYKFKRYNSMSSEEANVASNIIKKGILSDFLASPNEGFRGGKLVRKFEKKIESFFNVKNAIVVNSWTSGLICAVGALDIEPGDEIITTPWSMCATATSILHWNAIPIFADIDPETFCINPYSVEKLINSKTKAIIAVDIFGLSHDVDLLKKIVKKKNKNIKIIADSAQSPYSFYKKKIAGTMSDIGGYSFNCHKHIQTGEGGAIITNNNRLADRMRRIRNHAEATIKNKMNLNNLIGYNFRLGEIECGIGIVQLKKLKKMVMIKQNECRYISKRISRLKGIKVPFVPKNQTHSYYMFPILLDPKVLEVDKKFIFDALIKEGVQGLNNSYPIIYELPMYKKKIAYGKKGFPWSLSKKKINYNKGLCPVAEHLNENKIITLEICLFNLEKKDINLICESFEKIWKNLNSLKKLKNIKRLQ